MRMIGWISKSQFGSENLVINVAFWKIFDTRSQDVANVSRDICNCPNAELATVPKLCYVMLLLVTLVDNNASRCIVKISLLLISVSFCYLYWRRNRPVTLPRVYNVWVSKSVLKCGKVEQIKEVLDCGWQVVVSCENWLEQLVNETLQRHLHHHHRSSLYTMVCSAFCPQWDGNQ